jgi:hypothetical protein
VGSIPTLPISSIMEDFKLTNKEIVIKDHNGLPLIIPAEIKVFKNRQGLYTETIFGTIPFRKEDLTKNSIK